MDKIICCICGSSILEESHNALPIRSGRCCELCNWSEVVPARITSFRQRRLKDCLNNCSEKNSEKQVKNFRKAGD
jgi:hypothetical protein